MKFEWEDIFSQHNRGTISVGTWRAKVHGGWLVCNSVAGRDNASTALCFMPDQNHEWEIKKD